MGFHGHYTSHIIQNLTKDTYFANNISIVGEYSNIPNSMEGEYNHWVIHVQTRYVSGKICKNRLIFMVGYGENSNWRCHTFISKKFQEGISIRSVRLALVAPDHQEMNG